jgi:hypothetical protein
VTFSYSFLQGIYVFLDLILIKELTNKEMMDLFLFVMKKFYSLDFYKSDLNSI